ncbi:hypothetical protein BS78_10G175600 [Paspalum vaginatum]|nr:hypothetical protein BS78_10G175600 [Paspalum vaginatum]
MRAWAQIAAAGHGLWAWARATADAVAGRGQPPPGPARRGHCRMPAAATRPGFLGPRYRRC